MEGEGGALGGESHFNVDVFEPVHTVSTSQMIEDHRYAEA